MGNDDILLMFNMSTDIASSDLTRWWTDNERINVSYTICITPQPTTYA